jgi:CRISPR/Cas system-associated exonuclease Cas4 (RecB family)
MKNYMSISASSLSTFLRCSQQFKWQFLDELEPDEGTASIYTIFGSAFHKCQELMFRFKIDYKEIVASWRSLFLSMVTEEKAFVIPNESILNDFVNKGYVYLENARKIHERWHGYKIIEVETYHKFPFSNQFFDNVFLTGRIDLLLEKDDDCIVCLDWKTSKSKEKKIDENIQLTFYAYFVRQVYRYSFDSIFGALAYPFDSEILFSQRTEEQIDSLHRLINSVLEKISNKEFIKEPKLKNSSQDCFFCSYKETCKKNVR